MSGRKIKVEAHAGHRGAEYPKRFWLAGKLYEVTRIVARSAESDLNRNLTRRFVVETDAGEAFTLTYCEQEGQWLLE